MPGKSNKPKSKALYARIFGAPKGPQKAEGATKKEPKLGESSIAEYINFGGKFRDTKKDSKGYK